MELSRLLIAQLAVAFASGIGAAIANFGLAIVFLLAGILCSNLWLPYWLGGAFGGLYLLASFHTHRRLAQGKGGAAAAISVGITLLSAPVVFVVSIPWALFPATSCVN